ncbi:MAG: hypothetical protein ACI9VR_005005 [Cognaticolwellia sp.]
MIWLALACSAPEPQGKWLAADLHLHSSLGSNDTDGLGDPAALRAAMDAHGLDVVWLTDHSNSLGSMDCSDVEDCPNQGPETTPGDWGEDVYLGVELSPRAEGSSPVGHVGCLPIDGQSFAEDLVFTDRPFGDLDGAQTLAQCADAGGWSVVNHPESPFSWLAWDDSSQDYQAMEIYNGTLGFDSSDADAVKLWEARWQAGHRVVPVGGSDSHRWGSEPTERGLDPAPGWPTTGLFVREGQSELEALHAGQVVVYEPGTTLRFSASDGEEVVGVGESISGPVTLLAEASAQVSGLQLEIRSMDGDSLFVGPLGVESVVEDIGAGVYYARVWPEGEVLAQQGGVAISGVIEVLP